MALIYAGPHDLARQAFHQSGLKFEVFWPWMDLGEVVRVVLCAWNLRVGNLIPVPKQLHPLLAHIDVLHAAAFGSTLVRS